MCESVILTGDDELRIAFYQMNIVIHSLLNMFIVTHFSSSSFIIHITKM